MHKEMHSCLGAQTHHPASNPKPAARPAYIGGHRDKQTTARWEFVTKYESELFTQQNNEWKQSILSSSQRWKSAPKPALF